ncbi:hypothetical protein CAC42_7218 [Sphaceloma murrayae]|uniref:Transcription factor tau subunit sfc6 n=1 Tax=Sphaceloma murrayae TaxID=2082308 RepID=A0A2K1QPZ3_9PEZI|nr:hypothetical protein CAC42_7218 [Sphaceloma murrayae]
MAEPVRTSGRQRKATKKANFDPFAGLDIFDDDEPVIADDGNNTDDDFVAPPPEQRVPSEDEMVEDDVDGSAEAEVDEGDEDFDDVVDLDEVTTPKKSSRARNSKASGTGRPVPMSATQRVSRGLLDPRTRGSKESTRLCYFGPSQEDQEPFFKNHYRWRDQPVLPSRKADRSGFGGYHRSFYESEVKRKLEMQKDWKWYDDEGGKEAFVHLQKLEPMDEGSGMSYLSNGSSKTEVVAGPYGHQRKFDIPALGSLDLEEPFRTSAAPRLSNKHMNRERNGFFINVGGKVQTSAWCPNQGGNVQYIALAAIPLRSGTDPEAASPFHAQAPNKSAIQLWELKRTSEGYIDIQSPPSLRQVICTDFGDIRLLKWCIAPRSDEPETARGKHLGLLAGIWGDGHIRVLDITLDPAMESTRFSRLTSTAFYSRPPASIFSTLCWMSSHALIGAHSTGHISLFNLDKLSAGPARPLLTSPLQMSYIPSLTTCYPSRPHILISSSMSGHLSLTDLTRLTPTTGANPINTVLSPRSRLGRLTVVWHDWSQMVLSVDDNYALQGLPLRRFFGYTGLGRFRSAATAVAVSECHPFIAVSQTGGEVAVMNPMRRVLSTKESMICGRWFVHTWRRTRAPDLRIPSEGTEDDMMLGTTEGMEAEVNEMEERELARGQDKGMVRFVEGYKAEAVLLLRPGDERNPREIGMYSTIHEAQTAVTQVTWNPNLQCGGWIAAGTASGLLRVEDLGMA